MKPATYSFSRLDLYARCPWAYKTVYLNRIPRPETEALRTGNILHLLVRDYLTRLVVNQEACDWDWAASATPKHNCPPDVPEIWRRFFETWVMPAEITGPQIEKRLAFDADWQALPPDAYFSDAARFRAVVDFTFKQHDLAVVVDWKTNRAVPENVDLDFQLRVYGWAALKALYPDETEAILLRLHFLRYGVDREILLAPEDLADVPQEVDARIGIIENDSKFLPAPGSFCGMCGIAAHCPAMAQALVPVEVMAPATREQAEKAASLLLALREMESRLTDRLKEWVAANGPVQVGDLQFAPALTTTYDLDTQRVCEWLVSQGFEREGVWPMLSLTKTSLERGLKKAKRLELMDQILAAAPCKYGERYAFKKI